MIIEVPLPAVESPPPAPPPPAPPPPAPPPRRRRPRLVALAVVAVVVLLIGAAVRSLAPGSGGDVRDGTTAVTAEGMAARYGIDVTLVGVTANGGLVDFRYQVVDPDRADPVIHDIEAFPKLVVEDTGAVLALRSLPHSHGRDLQLGATYFFLVPNADNAVHEGSLVTVVIGDTRLEHVAVAG